MSNQTSSKNLVYFKRKSGACYSISVKPELPFANILAILARKQSISVNNLLLIHRGKTIQSTEFLSKLANKSIVHLLNLEEVKSERICLTLKDIRNNVSTKITDSGTKIRQFIKQHLAKIDQTPYFQIGLFYLGKILRPEKTFAEQLVQNNSEILVINLSDHLKTSKAPIDQKNTQAQKEEQKKPQIEIQSKEIQKTTQKNPQVDDLRSSPIRIDLETHQQEQKTNNKQQNQQEISDILPYEFQQTPSEEINKCQQNVPKTSEQKQIQRVDEKISAVKQDLKAQNQDINQQNLKTQQRKVKNFDILKKQTLQSKEGQRILQQLNQISQLPQITYYNFKIKISQVESQKSDEQEEGNKVNLNQQDMQSIQSSQCHQLQEKDIVQVPPAQVQPVPKTKIGQKDILPGDLIYTGTDYQSQTISFIDNLLKQYKSMFE